MACRELSDAKIKELLLEELEFLNTICRKNGIRYYLFYGSLIGAMRHSGFIPWDDDVDICMPRGDFKRLLEVINTDGRYRIVSIYNNENYTAPLAKIIDTKTVLEQHYGYREQVQLGVYIDVFIFDGLGNDEATAEEKYRRSVRLRKCWAATNHGWRYNDSIARDLLRFVYYLPQRVRGYRHYLKKLDEHAREFSFDGCKYVGNLMYPVYREVYHREDFEPIDVMFEGFSLVVPKGYDRLLTEIYGNWRTLPPIEKRASHHDYECYWA